MKGKDNRVTRMVALDAPFGVEDKRSFDNRGPKEDSGGLGGVYLVYAYIKKYLKLNVPHTSNKNYAETTMFLGKLASRPKNHSD